MESVSSSAINNHISLNREEVHCSSDVIERAGRIDIASKEHLKNENTFEKSGFDQIPSHELSHLSPRENLSKKSEPGFDHQKTLQVPEDAEEVSFDFDDFDILDKKDIETIEEGGKEKEAAVSVKMSTLEILESSKEKLKDTFILSGRTPEELKKSLETGNHEKLTNIKDPNPNLANRFKMDSKNHEIVVPEGSPLLQIKSKITINGVEYTVRAETEDERKEFETNWTAFTTALQNHAMATKNDKKDDSKDSAATKHVVVADRRGGVQKEILNNKNQDEILVEIQKKENNILALMKTQKEVQQERANKVKEWHAEEIKEEDLKKEIGKKQLSKDSINSESIKKLIIGCTNMFKSLNVFNIATSNHHQAVIISLVNRR